MAPPAGPDWLPQPLRSLVGPLPDARWRTLVPGLFKKVSTFGARFLSQRFASKTATQVLGKPHLALPARSAI